MRSPCSHCFIQFVCIELDVLLNVLPQVLELLFVSYHLSEDVITHGDELKSYLLLSYILFYIFIIIYLLLYVELDWPHTKSKDRVP